MFFTEVDATTTAATGPAAVSPAADARWGVHLSVTGTLHPVDRGYALNVGRRLRQLGRLPAHAADLTLDWLDGVDLPARVAVSLSRGDWHFVASATGRSYREALDRLEAGVRRDLTT